MSMAFSLSFSGAAAGVLTSSSIGGGGLSNDYYKETCPTAESVISDTIRNATLFDLKIPARILRMHFHDCFIRGCDASVLLDSTTTPKNEAEKDGAPNVSLRAFYVIDDAKTKIESICPQTVSCADILAIAARDVVVLAGGPHWHVLKGRKDGVVQGKGVFASDQALILQNGGSKAIVERFARDEKAFFNAFATSMLKMGSVGVLTSGGDVRINCRKVNNNNS